MVELKFYPGIVHVLASLVHHWARPIAESYL